MPFNWIYASTTTDAGDMNDNFQQIGSGSRLPTKLDTNGASFTNSVYDLGSGTYRWNTLYTNDVDFDGDCTNIWQRLSVVAIASATNRIQFGSTSGSSLNGDTDIAYRMIYRMVYAEQTAVTYLLFLGTSAGAISSSSYGLSLVSGVAATATADITTTAGFLLGNTSNLTSTSQLTFGELILYTETAKEKLIQITCMDEQCSDTYIGRVSKIGGILNSIGDTITNIVLTAGTTTGFGVGTYIELWVRR